MGAWKLETSTFATDIQHGTCGKCAKSQLSFQVGPPLRAAGGAKRRDNARQSCVSAYQAGCLQTSKDV